MIAQQIKDIWHNADERPEPFKTFVFKTDKGNTGSDMLSTNSDWNPILLPEFYSMDDFDKAEHITKWVYLDDLIALDAELIRTRKALDVAVDALKNIGASYPRITDIAMQDKANKALEQITALEQKDE